MSVASDLANCWIDNMILLYSKAYLGPGKVYTYFGRGYPPPFLHSQELGTGKKIPLQFFTFLFVKLKLKAYDRPHDYGVVLEAPGT